MELNKYTVDLSNVQRDKKLNHLEKNNFNDQILCVENMSKLVNNFNNNLNDKQELLKIIKKMRYYHGMIIKTFFDDLKSQGNFNHEEYYILSVTDTCYTTARNIIKQAEDILLGKKTQILDNIILNTDDSDNNIDTNNNNNDDINYIKNNIKNEINENIPTLVLFYESWCGACKAFKPIWNEIIRVTDTKYINFVDTNNDKFMTKHNIESIPTIILFTKNDKIIYEGGRNISQLADFINGHLNQNICKPLAA